MAADSVKPIGHGPDDVGFEALDARLAGVADLGQAIGAEERILEVVPVVLEHRAVDAHAVVGKGGLEAHFVVGQEVRHVGRNGAAAIDAAGPETFRPRGVQHHIVRGMEG